MDLTRFGKGTVGMPLPAEGSEGAQDSWDQALNEHPARKQVSEMVEPKAFIGFGRLKIRRVVTCRDGCWYGAVM